MTKYPKPNLKNFFFMQLLILVALAFVAFFVSETQNNQILFSVFLGGLSIFIPNIFFTLKFFSFDSAASGKGMQKLLAYQAGKILISIICLAISLTLLIYLNALMPKFFLGAFIFMLFLHIIFSSRLRIVNSR